MFVRCKNDFKIKKIQPYACKYEKNHKCHTDTPIVVFKRIAYFDVKTHFYDFKVLNNGIKQNFTIPIQNYKPNCKPN